MVKDSKVLVVAYKFNDIFYALATEEFKNATLRELIIISPGALRREDYPLLDIFDNVYFLKYLSVIDKISVYFKLINIIKRDFDFVILSNPILVINQFLVKLAKPQYVVLLEDGLMNYKDFKPSKSIIKSVCQLIIGVSNSFIEKLIRVTYLLSPDEANFAFGKRTKLNLASVSLSNNISTLNNKSVFVGQNLYDYGYMSICDYNNIVNKVIRDNNISHYIPHPFCSAEENVNLAINYKLEKETLEVLASSNKITIYSFNSSVLFTTKLINPNNITAVMVQCEMLNKINVDIIKKYCDLIIKV